MGKRARWTGRLAPTDVTWLPPSSKIAVGKEGIDFLSGWRRIQVLVKEEEEELSCPQQDLSHRPEEGLLCLPGPEGSESLAKR